MNSVPLVESRELLTEKGERMAHGEKCAERMTEILQRNGGWMKRDELEQHGLPPRLCRLGRQHSKGRIISGQLGYRLTATASLAEIHEAATSMKVQATTLMGEVQELWRVINQRGITAQ